MTGAEKKKRDSGVSVAIAACGNGTCLNKVKDRLVEMPNGIKDKVSTVGPESTTFKNNWGSNGVRTKTEYKAKIAKFDIATEGLELLFNEFPPEFKAIYDKLNEAGEIINEIDEQIAEAEKKATEWIDIEAPDWDWLKDAQEKLDEIKQDLDKAIQDLENKIPDLTSDRDICD
jgi:chromosome segregation ATPase